MKNTGNKELGQIDPTQSQKPVCFTQGKEKNIIKPKNPLARHACRTSPLPPPPHFTFSRLLAKDP